MKMISKTITSVDIALSRILHFLSYVVPRNKKTWVFIGWHKSPSGEIFADNAKYFYLYMSQVTKDLKIIWLAKDKKMADLLVKKGYQSYHQKSLRGIFFALTAQYTVLDAYLQRENFRWTGGTKIVQLLHGKGMKAKGYSEKPLQKNDYIFNTSNFTLEILPQNFKNGSKTFITGYSRNDIIFREINDALISVDIEAIEKLTRSKEGSEKLLRVWYAPTFRRGQKEFNFQKIFDLVKISDWSTQNNILFCVSLHPKYREQVKNYNYSNIYFIKESDVYPLFNHIDLLIADYSSIFSDFLLIDKPIVFYAHDLNEYMQNEGISVPYQNITPGPKVETMDKLFDAIIQFKQGLDYYKQERKNILNLYHKYTDGNSSQRILEILASEEEMTVSRK